MAPAEPAPRWLEDPRLSLESLTPGQRYVAFIVIVLGVIMLRFGIPHGTGVIPASSLLSPGPSSAGVNPGLPSGGSPAPPTGSVGTTAVPGADPGTVPSVPLSSPVSAVPTASVPPSGAAAASAGAPPLPGSSGASGVRRSPGMGTNAPSARQTPSSSARPSGQAPPPAPPSSSACSPATVPLLGSVPCPAP